MEIIQWKNTQDQKKYIVNAFKKGKVIVYPTETAYAIGCDAMNKKSIHRISKIKKRGGGKKWPLIASSIYQVQKFAKMNKNELKLAIKKWPGAFTLVLDRRNFNDKLAEQGDTIAIRVSGLCLARYFAKKLGNPIVSTSANISGSSVQYSIAEIINQFKNSSQKPDIIIDYGKLSGKKPSKIVRVEDDNLKILRK